MPTLNALRAVTWQEQIALSYRTQTFSSLWVWQCWVTICTGLTVSSRWLKGWTNLLEMGAHAYRDGYHTLPPSTLWKRSTHRSLRPTHVLVTMGAVLTSALLRVMEHLAAPVPCTWCCCRTCCTVESRLPAQQSNSPAPQGRLIAFLWPGVATAFQNVKMAVMKTTVPSVLHTSSDVTKEAALMLKDAAMVNWTVLITLMSRTVKLSALPTSSAVVTINVSQRNNSVTITPTVLMDQMSSPASMCHLPPVASLALGPTLSAQLLPSSCSSSSSGELILSASVWCVDDTKAPVGLFLMSTSAGHPMYLSTSSPPAVLSMVPIKVSPVGSPWWVLSVWWAAAAVELLFMIEIMWLELHPAALHLQREPSILRSWILLPLQPLTALSTTQRSSTLPTVHLPPDHIDPITRSVAPSHLPLPAVPMSATATTLPTTRRLGWGCQWVAGRALAMAATPNTSTTWTSTQTLTHTLHPPRPDPSICQLRKAALHPLLQSVPTSTYVPLLPLLALTLHDPQQPGTPVRKKGMKSASYESFISAD